MLPAAGAIFRNPGLARSLAGRGRGRPRRLLSRAARRGDRGAIRSRWAAFSRVQDFAEHTSTWVEPVSTNYRGYDVWELPPNGQGIAALQMLNLLEPYDLKSMGFGSAEALHLMIEAKKLAYEDRAKYYADMEKAQGSRHGADLQGLRRQASIAHRSQASATPTRPPANRFRPTRST